MINQCQLKQHLLYDDETGVFTRKISNSNKCKVGDVAGYVNSHGYRIIRVLSKMYPAHRLAWLYMFGEFPKKEIDHIDGVKDNNKIKNLRECDKFQNQCNTLARKGSSVKSKGVDFMKNRGKYRARIRVRGKDLHLGLFETELEANDAYLFASKAYQEGYHTTRSSQQKDLNNVKRQESE